MVACAAERTAAQEAGEPRRARVLLLFQQQAETGPMREFTERLRTTIIEELGSPVDFYQEALDLDRFKGREHSRALVNYFADKFRGFGIDVVVPVGARALSFAVGDLRTVLPDVPVVFALCAAPQTNPATLPPNVTGRIASPSRFEPTVEMARRLQPDAERIVVIGGAGPADSVSLRAAVAAANSLRGTLPLHVIQGLPFNELLHRVRDIPRRSIVLFGNYRQDGQGEAFDPFDVIGTIARATNAPMYGQLYTYVGQGVVGGSVMRFADEGVHTARLVVRVLHRRAGAPLPPAELIAESFVVDWRELRRWGLSENRLPRGTEVAFREPGMWQRHGAVILGAAAVIVVESLLVWLLVAERRRRIRAQLILDEQQRGAEEARLQVAHMGRLVLVGELAATMSHELRQPLAAIRANAEAGVFLATKDPAEAREIFRNIVDDDDRAVQVIESVRTLLRKDQTVAVCELDLNQICGDAVRLLQHDAARRRVRLVLSLASVPAHVTGDAVQLQQVVLNLVLNGIEASAASGADPFVAVQTEVEDAVVELRVRDSGPGVPVAMQSRVFESFFSTKSGGLGLGLAIVRSIVERHAGHVSSENDIAGGAVFRVRLPRASVREAGVPGVVGPAAKADRYPVLEVVRASAIATRA